MSIDATLPSGWSSAALIESIEKVMDFRGRTPRKLGMEWGDGTIPAFSAGNIKMGRIDVAAECHLGSEALYKRWMTSGDMRPGDVLITTEAPLGNVAVVPDSRKYILSQRTVLLRPDPARFDNAFFFHYLQSPAFQRQLVENATGSTALGIQRRRLEKLTVRCPPLAEQRRIAQALNDVDAQIAALERLIAKKQDVKQAMMQDLLTGRTRLPGFTGQWNEHRLSDVAPIDPEALTTGATDAVIDYISLEDVNRGVILGSAKIQFGAAPSRARRVVRMNDVLFGTVRPNLQSHALYAGGLTRPIASTGFAVIRATPGHADPRFLLHFVMSRLASVQVDRIIAGSNYPAVSSRDVGGLRVRLPEIEEQTVIAGALTDVDANIGVLRLRLAKAKSIKQGMMQELLSGRTRLPLGEPEAVAA